MRILFAAPPGYGLMLPIVPLVWAARAAGHEVLVATSGQMPTVIAEAGLPVVDVCPGEDVWGQLTRAMRDPDDPNLSETMRSVTGTGNPFGYFTLTMTEGTVAAARAFGAELVVHTSDHEAGALTASALGLPSLEAGNRMSWSMRDGNLFTRIDPENAATAPALVRERLAIPDTPPKPLARLDIRAPSMGGIATDEADARDGLPWWPMRYVPYNGGAVLPDWALAEPARPRVGVTLGTVVPQMSGMSTLSAVVEVLAAMDVEVILAGGTADVGTLGALPDNVRSVGYLPLSAFLARCSLLVHHGGSGTTAAPLYYGVPQLVLPSFADNPMSAERVAARGVGLAHDPATLTAEVAAESLTRLLSEPGFATAAREVAAEIAEMPSPASVLARVEAALG